MNPTQKAMAGQTNRENPEWFLTNFLKNVSKSARLMRANMPYGRTDRLLFQESIRSYIISLVGALETFYRDLFVHLYAGRQEQVVAIVSRLRRGSHIVNHHPDLTTAEIASTILSFQRMAEVEVALSPLISDSRGYFAVITEYPAICIIPSHSPLPARVSLSPGWRETIDGLLAARHRYVHDRNCDCDTSATFMQQAEADVVLLGQLTAFYFTGRLIFAITPDGALPALLLVEDLVANDWQVHE